MVSLKNYSHLPIGAQHMIIEISESCKAEVERGRLGKEEIVEAFKILLDSWKVPLL